MMLNNPETNKKLASIHNKIESINERIQDGRLYSMSSQSFDTNMTVFERARVLFRRAAEKQSFYAHCFKLLTLFCISIVHLIYMQSFFDAYNALEAYTVRVNDVMLNNFDSPKAEDQQVFLAQMSVIADYKQNNWMCVACMCIALVTTCFFLFIIPFSNVSRRKLCALVVLDLSTFTALPILMAMRMFIAESLEKGLAAGMRAGHKVASAERVMNILQCTVLPREKLPYCSDVVLTTILPVVIIKYIIILCLLTLLYIALAYLIEYCIRHWFPHAENGSKRSSNSSCCVSRYRTQMDAIRPLRHYANNSYVPVLFAQDPMKAHMQSIPSASVSVLPLIQHVDEQDDGHFHVDRFSTRSDSIPSEPRPTLEL